MQERPVFLASYVLRKIGSLTILTIYGLLFAMAFMAYSFFPNITTVMMVVISLRIFEYGLNKPTRESIYTKLKQQDRYKSTVFIDTFLARSGDVIGGWFVRGLVGRPTLSQTILQLRHRIEQGRCQ